jgi:DNA-binding NtrC family response regulator
MSTKQTELSVDEKEFFRLVAKTVYTNPFSHERAEIDNTLIGHDDFDRSTGIQQLLESVRGRVAKLDTQGRGKISQYRGEDRQIMRYTFLYLAYHQNYDRFNSLIQDQLIAGESSVDVHWAQEVMEWLVLRGFTPEESILYFGLFYQLQRAFHFIQDALIGQSDSMRSLRISLWNNVFTSDIRLYETAMRSRMEDFSTLMLGETGCGKGAAAAAIGRSGFIPFDDRHSRFAESFMNVFTSINLSQFPESLIESELFGHKKGAFTGAIENFQGVFSRCSKNGSIFLDEIGDVSIPIQIKLLQVLQDRQFTPVGSHTSQRFSGRVIAATNKDVHELRCEGLFRDDFYYRLCSDIIHVPTLRQRIQEYPNELPLLARSLLRRILGEDQPHIAEHLVISINNNLPPNYDWPGNVRELEQCIRRILLTGKYSGDVQHARDNEAIIMQSIKNCAYDAQSLLADYCALLYTRLGTYEDVAKRMDIDRRTAKKHILNSTLHKTAGQND